ncbi:MAG: hypothetical protein M1819_006063 [Sarea resinae]|nr:MAG: hypothetical protein M1819_006063 [Sarea resinae]
MSALSSPTSPKSPKSPRWGNIRWASSPERGPDLNSYNFKGRRPSILSLERFQIVAPPATDIWRKPPDVSDFTAPIVYRSFHPSRFRKARLTVAADWKTLYDQGGLILVNSQAEGIKKWVKAGIEFYKGKPQVSVVAADRWADWGLIPTTFKDPNTVTIEFEREMTARGTPGTVLTVYIVDGEDRFPIREVTWAFENSASKEYWIGAYAAKPTREEGDPNQSLHVDFTDFHIELTD